MKSLKARPPWDRRNCIYRPIVSTKMTLDLRLPNRKMTVKTESITQFSTAGSQIWFSITLQTMKTHNLLSLFLLGTSWPTGSAKVTTSSCCTPQEAVFSNRSDGELPLESHLTWTLLPPLYSICFINSLFDAVSYNPMGMDFQSRALCTRSL